MHLRVLMGLKYNFDIGESIKSVNSFRKTMIAT